MKKLTKYKRMSDHIILLDDHPGHLRRHVIIVLNSLSNTSRVRRPRYHATFILTTIIRCRPNYQFGTATLDSVQPPILHCLPSCPHELLVTVWITTSSICKETRQRTTMKLELGWTVILTYLPTLTSKETMSTSSALQSSPSWFP